jgi:hypothetical protein
MVLIRRSDTADRPAVAQEAFVQADQPVVATSTALPFSTPVEELKLSPAAAPAPQPPAQDAEPPQEPADPPPSSSAATDPAPPPAQDRPSAPAEPAVCSVDHRYGTSVDFVDSPAEAGEQALKEKKLLFVLHVAGNFEKDQFT